MQEPFNGQRANCVFYGKNSFINDSLITLLSGSGQIHIEHQTDNSRNLLEAMKNSLPQGVLIDMDSPETPLDALIQTIRTRMLLSRIILLSSYPTTLEVAKAKKWGANGFVPKSFTRDQLLQSICLVLSGIDFFPHFQQQLAEQEFIWDAICHNHHITQREKEILLLINNGLTNKEIAARLYLSILTVETHRKHIMQKLQLSSPTALLKFLMENGL